MNVSLSASGTPSAVRAELEKQVRSQGDANPSSRAALRGLQQYVTGCIDDAAASVSVSGSVGIYVANTLPEIPTATPEQAQNTAPATPAPAAAT